MATGSKKAQMTAARLVGVQCVHQMLISGADAAGTLQHYRDHLMNQDQEGDTYVPADLTLLSAIVNGVDTRRAELGEMILGALGVRETTRLPEPLLLAILLCGTYEMMGQMDTDAPIIIADYLSVADGFFEGGEPKIVNAVLDKLAKSLRG